MDRCEFTVKTEKNCFYLMLSCVDIGQLNDEHLFGFLTKEEDEQMLKGLNVD